MAKVVATHDSPLLLRDVGNAKSNQFIQFALVRPSGELGLSESIYLGFRVRDHLKMFFEVMRVEHFILLNT